MNPDKFSWSRMWALTRRNVIENRRLLLMASGVIFGLMLLVDLLITKECYQYGDYGNENRAGTVLAVMVWCAGMASLATGSLTFSRYNSKQRRITNLMLPASQSEKFVSNVAIYIVGGNIALALFIFLADTLSALLFGMTPAWLQLHLGKLLAGADIQAMICTGLFFLWWLLISQSVYVIGSALWPKNSFAKTFVVLLVLTVALPLVIPSGFWHLAGDFIEWLSDALSLSEAMRYVAMWLLIAVLYAVLAGLYFIAWKIFSRMQVIQRFKMK